MSLSRDVHRQYTLHIKVLLGALVKHFRFEKIMSKRVSDIYDICYGTEVEEKGT